MSADLPPPDTVTDFMISFGIFCLSLFLCFSTYFLVFAPIVLANFVTAGAVTLTCAIIFVILKSVKKALDDHHAKWGTEMWNGCNNDRMVGLGGVTICAIIPRIAVYFVSKDNYTLIYIHTVFLVSAITFHYLFNYQNNRLCTYISHNNVAPHSFIFCFNLFALIISLRLCGFYKIDSEILWIIFTQIGFTLISFSSSIEFFMVWNNELRLKGYYVDYPAHKIKPETFTDVIMSSYFLITSSLFVILVCYLILSLSVAWKFVGITVASCVAIYGFLVMVQWLVIGICGWLNARTSTLINTELLVGFGGIMACGWAPRVAVYLVNMNVQILSFTVLLSLFSAIIFHTLFITSHHELWTFDAHHWKLNSILVFVNVIALLVSFRIAMQYTNRQETELIFWFQVGLMAICTTSMVDFGLVLAGALTIDEKMEVYLEEMDMMSKLGSKKETKSGASFECKICVLEYDSYKRTPKILKQCGHTVCEACAKKLLQKGYWRKIVCPFCQTATVVDGSTHLLPKNYEVLEMV